MGGLCLASTRLWGAGSAPAHPPNHLSAPRNRPEGKVLETVGVFEPPKQHGKYETGQVSGSGGAELTLRPRSTEPGEPSDLPVRTELQTLHSSVLRVSAASAVCPSSGSSQLIRICSATQLFSRDVCSAALI